MMKAMNLSGRGPDSRVDRINRLLVANRRTASWMAKQLGVPRQSVYNWLGGLALPRDESVWDRMAGLFPEKVPPPLDAPLYPAVVPEVEMSLWPSLPANGSWDEPQESMDFIDVPSFLARKSLRHPERVAVRIRGSSMEPRLLDGDLVVIELSQQPRSGRIVVARSGAAVTVKLLTRDTGGALALKALNKGHEVEPRKSEIVGYVVAVLRGYDRGRGVIEWDDGGLGL